MTDAAGTTTYTWNAKNELTGLSGPGLSGSVEYDGLGRRTKKVITSTTTEFLYDGLNPVQEKNGAAVLANLLTGLGLDEVFRRTDTAGARDLLPDALGSTLAQADGAGTVQTEYTYEPFGQTTATGQTSTNTFKYTGREDDGTGLYYYRARYYHPGLGRFLSEDPRLSLGWRNCFLGLPQSLLGAVLPDDIRDLNHYAYAANNPLLFIDSQGLSHHLVDECPNCPRLTACALVASPTIETEPIFRHGYGGPLNFRICKYVCCGKSGCIDMPPLRLRCKRFVNI